jgi:hypothetical protein
MTIYSPKRCCDEKPCCCEETVRPIVPIPPIVPFGVFADYYALAPADNAEAIAAGEAIDFPRGSSSDFRMISRVDDSTFNLAKTGAYLIMFNICTDDPAQVELELNGVALSYTATGRDIQGTQINGMSVVTVTQPNSTLSVINTAESENEVVITQNAGGTTPSSSHLIIVKLA